MALTKILEKKWSYTLYNADGVYIVSVVCGGVGLFEINIPLSYGVGEKALKDVDFLGRLVAEISNVLKNTPLEVCRLMNKIECGNPLGKH